MYEINPDIFGLAAQQVLVRLFQISTGPTPFEVDVCVKLLTIGRGDTVAYVEWDAPEPFLRPRSENVLCSQFSQLKNLTKTFQDWHKVEPDWLIPVPFVGRWGDRPPSQREIRPCSVTAFAHLARVQVLLAQRYTPGDDVFGPLRTRFDAFMAANARELTNSLSLLI